MSADVADHAQQVPARAIRLVALDVDGTLLDRQGRIAPRTRAAIRAAVERGVLVTLCTGRPLSVGVREISEDLGLSLPVILRNGTCMQDAASGAVLHAQAIREPATRAALDAMLASGTVPVVEEGPLNGERLFTLSCARSDPAFTFLAAYWQRGPYVEYVDTEALYGAGAPTWIGACGTAATARHAHAALQQIAGVTCFWTGDRWTEPDYHLAEVLPANSSKAAGLRWLAAARGIDLSEVLAVGDSYNDVEMLSEVGWGVAMGQAPAAVRAAANAVLPDNATDGAAIVIERYVLTRAYRRVGPSAAPLSR